MSDEQPLDDDLLAFADDEPQAGPAGPAGTERVWRVLVVDDDEQVHQVTLFSLGDLDVSGRRLVFLHAYNGAEAREILSQGEPIAVVLLDVVMETDDAGLQLVRWIRQELRNLEVRIILRTGQPGYAPELEVIRDYDINDYRAKSELTRTRLVSALTTAIRAYEQLTIVTQAREGLSQIIHSSNELLSRRAMGEFASGVLTQLAALLRIETDGLLFAHSSQANKELCVIGAAGHYADLIGLPAEAVDDPAVAALMRRCLDQRRSIFDPQATVLYIEAPEERRVVVYLDSPEPIDDVNRQLLEVFAVNIGVGFENVSMFEHMQQLAFFDHLTKLPNRGRVLETLSAIPDGQRRELTLALLYVDRFTEFNDALGHKTGDELLLGITERIRRAVDDDMVLGRVGAGLFSILGRDDRLDPGRIVAQFTKPVHAGGYDVPVSVHLGLARVRDTDAVQSDPFKGASIAVNNARRDSAEPWQYYSQDQELEGRDRLDLLQGLRAALDNNELVVFYQPQVDLQTDLVIGAEALIRWRRGPGQFVSPARFIPLAEYSGLIIPIGNFVLRSACAQVVRWQAEGLTGLRIGVNVSSRQFQRADYVETVATTLRETGVDPRLIELEVTESAAMSDVEQVIRVLHELRGLGVTLAIDDFGTGYSSLSYLHRLPVDRLKVDQSFVMKMDVNEGEEIPKMVIDLAHQLGLSAIAEGIQTTEHAQALRRMGCEEGQGFLYSKPVDAPEYRDWVLAHRAR